MKRRTPEQVVALQATVTRLRLSGLPYREIAAQTGVSLVHAARLVRAAGVPSFWARHKRPQGLTDRQRQGLALYKQGLTFQAIGEQLGITKASAFGLVNRALEAPTDREAAA